jgi:hypothetical protein
MSWVSIRDVTQSSPAQPGSRAPGAPHPPMRPLLLSLSHLDFPRNNLSLPLPSLSPRGALGLGDGDRRNLDPEVSSPPLPSPLSLPLSLSLLSPPARPPLLSPARRRGTPPLPFPVRRGPSPPLPGGARPRPSPFPSDAAPPLPSPAALGPPLLPGPLARPCAGARLRPLRAAVLAPLRGVRPSD